MEKTTITFLINHSTEDGLAAIFQDFDSHHLYHFQEIKTTELENGTYDTEIQYTQYRRFDFIDDIAVITSNLVRYLTTAHGDDTIYDYAPDAVEVYKNTLHTMVEYYNSTFEILSHQASMISGLINIANQAISLFNHVLGDPEFPLDTLDPDILNNI